MPNHIKNKIQLIGEDQKINKVFEAFNTHYPATLNKAYDGSIICRNKDGDVGWFNANTGKFKRREKKDVQGLPDGWSMEIKESFDAFPDFEKVIPPPENIFRGNLGDEEREMCKREGRPNWYDWNYENWGTKWNSYSHTRIGGSTFLFETAWAGVVNIVREMSKMFPDVEFYYKWSDEDTGYNCGEVRLKNGEGDVHIPEGGSNEAYEIAFELRPERKSWYKIIDGQYVYDENAELI